VHLFASGIGLKISGRCKHTPARVLRARADGWRPYPAFAVGHPCRSAGAGELKFSTSLVTHERSALGVGPMLDAWLIELTLWVLLSARLALYVPLKIPQNSSLIWRLQTQPQRPRDAPQPRVRCGLGMPRRKGGVNNELVPLFSHSNIGSHRSRTAHPPRSFRVQQPDSCR
jgi:hypothetical protein